ncbi:MAG: hypothetical protein JXR31_11670 [Prolixibacteraceae bacterium]|nr:hypothetical protein [Prolixibacteraceae bacterium]MBN2774902.1 hypothetical protein [Prolixibacteraceae bacterium]
MTGIFKNVLLISGTGRKVGKTSFACQIISKNKGLSLTAVKISPHFHLPTNGLIKIDEGNGWIISEETNRHSKKDSSLFLQAGAIKCFYIQCEKEKLSTFAENLKKILPANSPVIIESAGLSEIIKPGIFLLITNNINKSKNNSLSPDQVIFSTGKKFIPNAESFIFDNEWKQIK